MACRRRLELNCALCSEGLTTMQTTLPEDVLQMVAEQNALMKKKVDASTDYSQHLDLEHEQVVATKCGHMFHIGCLRGHVKRCVEAVGTAQCPICQKPVTLTRLWPILIPPTPSQIARYKKLHSLKKNNTELKVETTSIRGSIQQSQAELVQVEKDIQETIAEIDEKQRQINEMQGPTEDEMEELRKIHKRRQTIVRAVTKHNADLLGVLMHETNVQVSDQDILAVRQMQSDINNNDNLLPLSQLSLEEDLKRVRSRSRGRDLRANRHLPSRPHFTASELEAAARQAILDQTKMMQPRHGGGRSSSSVDFTVGPTTTNTTNVGNKSRNVRVPQPPQNSLNRGRSRNNNNKLPPITNTNKARSKR